MRLVHSLQLRISFGDCDPTGVVFHPNVFSWFDRTFHDWLRRFGGHARVCAELGAVGVGLIEVNAWFMRPMRDGDLLTLGFSIEEWGRKTLRLSYEGSVGGETALAGTELRGLFKLGDRGMFAAEMAALHAMVESDDQR